MFLFFCLIVNRNALKKQKVDLINPPFYIIIESYYYLFVLASNAFNLSVISNAR